MWPSCLWCHITQLESALLALGNKRSLDGVERPSLHIIGNGALSTGLHLIIATQRCYAA